jgi:hypothetical protein
MPTVREVGLQLDGLEDEVGARRDNLEARLKKMVKAFFASSVTPTRTLFVRCLT